jgi:hypothetical protein
MAVDEMSRDESNTSDGKHGITWRANIRPIRPWSEAPIELHEAPRS